MFRKADDIITAYRKRCMELSIFDFGMAVELYNKYLITDETYRGQLFKRIDHLIVDNIEECVPTEVDFIDFLLPHLKTCLMGYNHEERYEAFGSNHEYMKQKLLGRIETVELNNPLHARIICMSFRTYF